MHTDCCMSYFLKLSALLLFLCLVFRANAQQRTIDSIERLLPAQRDSVLAASYNELTWQYRTIDRKKAISYGQKAIELSHRINYLKGEAQAYNDLGILYMDAQDFEAALSSYTKAIPIRRQLNDQKGLAAVYLKMGIVYQKWGKFDKALGHGQQSLQLYEALKDDFGTATALNNIGITNHNIGHEDVALDYYKRSLEIRLRIKDQNGIAMSYLNMGNAWFNKGDLAKGKMYFEDADSIGKIAKAFETISTATHNLAGIYEKTGPYDKGLSLVEEAFTIRQKMGDMKGMASSLSVWGGLFIRTKNYPKAEEKLLQALQVADTLQSCLPEKVQIYSNLNKLYEATGDYKKASEMGRMVLQCKDSIYTTDMNKRFSEMETKYQTAVKEQQIQQQKFELSKKNYILAGVCGVLLLCILLGFSYYKRFRLKQERQLQAEIIHQQDIASKGIIEAEERERKRIAGDLHDGIGQLFSAVKMNLSAISGSIKFEDQQTAESYDKTLAMVDESCKEVRSISHQMMPNTLLKYGLASAVRDFISKIDTRQLKVHLEISGLNERLDSNTETVLYRVLQETVNNVIKHAGASQLDIQLNKEEDGVTATIEDNGHGFDMTTIEQREGIGLKNIRTRIEYLKGHVEFDSTPGRGTVVSVWVPVNPVS